MKSVKTIVYIYKYHLYFIFIFILSFMVAVRIFGAGPDYANYKAFFSLSNNIKHIEPFFYLLRAINIILFKGNVFPVFLFTSFIALLLKFNFIVHYAHNIFISFIFYICTFFFLHEYTQIRVAIAIGIFLISIKDIINHRLNYFLLKTFIACMFHYSSVIMLIIYIYCNGLTKNKRFYILLPWFIFIIDIIISMVLKLEYSYKGIFSILITEDARDRWWILNYIYKHVGSADNELSVFNKVYFSLLCVCSFIYYSYSGFVSSKYINDFCLFKIMTFSVVIYYFLLNFAMPVLAFRCSEYVFPVVSVILPNTIKRIREKYIIFLLVIIYAILFFFLFARVVF